MCDFIFPDVPIGFTQLPDKLVFRIVNSARPFKHQFAGLPGESD